MRVKVAEAVETDTVVMALYLEESIVDDDIVYLKATDASGDEWTIAEIDKNGMTLVDSIDADTGWPLTKDGQLMLVK